MEDIRTTEGIRWLCPRCKMFYHPYTFHSCPLPIENNMPKKEKTPSDSFPGQIDKAFKKGRGTGEARLRESESTRNRVPSEVALDAQRTTTFNQCTRIIRVGDAEFTLVVVANRREAKDQPIPQGTPQYIAVSRIVAIVPIEATVNGPDKGIHDYYPMALSRIHLYDPSETMLTIEIEESIEDFSSRFGL